VYRSEDVHNNLNPEWAEVCIELSVLCGGKWDHPIKLAVFDYESSGKHIPMGSLETSVNGLKLAQERREDLKLKQKGNDVGTIEIARMSINDDGGGGGGGVAEVTQELQSTTISSSEPAAGVAPTDSFFAMGRDFESNKRKYKLLYAQRG
jgi:hypothetical protein